VVVGVWEWVRVVCSGGGGEEREEGWDERGGGEGVGRGWEGGGETGRGRQGDTERRKGSGVGGSFGAEFGEVVLDQLDFVFFVGGSGDVAVVVEVVVLGRRRAVFGVPLHQEGKAALHGVAVLFELAFVGEATGVEIWDLGFGIGDWSGRSTGY
jgi:hypothetical protein